MLISDYSMYVSQPLQNVAFAVTTGFFGPHTGEHWPTHTGEHWHNG